MALENGVAKITFGIRDAKGQRGKVSFFLKYYRETREPPFDWLHGLCEPDWYLQDFLQLLAQKLDAFIKGSIESISYNVTVPLPVGLKGYPLADSDCEEGAAITFLTEGNHIALQTIPTFDHAIFGDLTELRSLLTVPDELNEWIGYLLSPVDQEYEYTQISSDNRGDPLDQWTVIKRIFRPRRKDRA